MNLDDWGELKSFESIIPCTTPTWAVWALDDGEAVLGRIAVWRVTQRLDTFAEKPEVYAELHGLTAAIDGIMSVTEDANFVGYLDETELPQAKGYVAAWLARHRQKVDA